MEQDEDNAVTAARDKAAAEADQYMAALKKRAAELEKTGLSEWVAFGTARLEAHIARWPEEWGDNLQVLIYGDFDAPDHDLDYPALGITVEAGKRGNTFIRTALCVVSARVKVQEKSLSAVLDAAARLNTFLGIWAILDWGNRGVGWWCHLTSESIGGMGGPFEKNGIEDVLTGIERLPPDVKRKVRAALYWIREPKQMMLEEFRNDDGGTRIDDSQAGRRTTSLPTAQDPSARESVGAARSAKMPGPRLARHAGTRRRY